MSVATLEESLPVMNNKLASNCSRDCPFFGVLLLGFYFIPSCSNYINVTVLFFFCRHRPPFRFICVSCWSRREGRLTPDICSRLKIFLQGKGTYEHTFYSDRIYRICVPCSSDAVLLNTNHTKLDLKHH